MEGYVKVTRAIMANRRLALYENGSTGRTHSERHAIETEIHTEVRYASSTHRLVYLMEHLQLDTYGCMGSCGMHHSNMLA